MLTFVSGDLFTSPAKVLVNAVNTVGVMGKGIAKTFKNVYPEMFQEYQRLCEAQRLIIGTLWLYKTPHKWILSFPTKQHWRNPSRPDFIEAGLKKFVASYAEQGLTSVAFPRLGCGNGELDWDTVVRPLMLKYLDHLAIDVFVHHFDSHVLVPEHRDADSMRKWLRSQPRTLPFAEMWADLSARIGSGTTVNPWGGGDRFRVSVCPGHLPGLRVQLHAPNTWQRLLERMTKYLPIAQLRIIGPGDLLIEEEALVDLWQSIRAYGFCMPRVMPAGLDVLASHVMPIMALLDYLKPVKVTVPTATIGPPMETALQLIPPAGVAPNVNTGGSEPFLPSPQAA